MVLAVAKKSRAFRFLMLACWVCGRLGGDAARRADPSCPKGCSTPYGIMLGV